MILNAISSAYGAAASWRRHRYARDLSLVRRLCQPVVSVGNLRMGGSGKTPIVAHLARLLLGCGERPAILTRGYARRRPQPGVTVVSDGSHVLTDVAAAGDEPLMLARALPGVPVLVGADRYLSGRLAERRFAATVHLLDDGFQHFELARTVDLLLMDASDLSDRVVPAGHLREPLTAARAASALLVSGGAEAAERIGRFVGIDTTFLVSRTIGTARIVATHAPLLAGDGPVFAFAGVARPERFFADLTAAGWNVAGRMAFRDHHVFTDADLGRIAAGASGVGAGAVVTTEKDAVRLGTRQVGQLALAVIPLAMTIEPADRFRAWIVSSIAQAPTDRGGTGHMAGSAALTRE